MNVVLAAGTTQDCSGGQPGSVAALRQSLEVVVHWFTLAVEDELGLSVPNWN